MSFDPIFNLADLDGSNGFVIEGIDRIGRVGSSVSSAGDINGDDIDDIIIGARSASGNSASGESYVIFGSNSGFASSLNVSTLNGSNGFTINGVDYLDQAGYSVSSAGDINDDGIDDIIIGAPYAGNLSSGESYVIFGSNSGFGASLDVSNLNGNNGFTIHGINDSDLSGYSVSGAGDVNGDGIDDIIIGAPNARRDGLNNAGESYVVYGSSSGFPSNLELSSLDGRNGSTIVNNVDTYSQLGTSVSGAGDVNGDGFDDIVIGAPFVSVSGFSGFLGGSYVLYGSSSGFPSNLELSSLNGSNGFSTYGVDRYSRSGLSVSGAGDINSDGFDDIIIGSQYNNSAEILFGGRDIPNYNFDLLSFSSVDLGDTLGFSVDGGGDINGDGIDDIIIGAPNADPDNIMRAGESYVIFGNSNILSEGLDLSEIDGSNGFVIPGINNHDLSGTSVSITEDINGDGINDIIIGAPFAGSYSDPNNRDSAGESYVIFGRSSSEVIPDEFLDDNYEENDIQVDAYNLSNFENTWLSNIAGLGQQFDDDWYKITLDSGNQLLTIDLEFSHAEGDIDVAIYDENQEFIASSTSITDNELLETIIPAAGDYYLQVYYDDLGNSYDLRWNSEVFIDDAYEENDTQADAYDLRNFENTWLSDISGLGLQYDNDWYKVSVAPGERLLTVDVEFLDAEDYTYIELYDANQQFITGETLSTDLITWVPSPGDYYVRIEQGNVGNSYDLRWYNGVALDDAYEENDDLLGAYDISNQEQTWLEDISGLGTSYDEDWYQIDVDLDFENLVVDLRFSHAAGDVDISVYDADGNYIIGATSVTDNELIDTILPSSGTYYLQVETYGGYLGNTYNLWWDDLAV